MGDSASNVYLCPHRRVGIGLVGVALGKHLGAGNPISWSPEITPAAYNAARAQALQSQAAFDAAAASAWGPWYMQSYPTAEERAEARHHVLDYAP